MTNDTKKVNDNKEKSQPNEFIWHTTYNREYISRLTSALFTIYFK